MSTATSSLALNDKVRQYPFSSNRYQRLFNQKAEELGFDLRWTSDRHDPNSIEPDELQVGASTRESFDPGTTRQVRTVFESVEAERQELVRKSAAHNDRIPFRAPLEQLSPVEREAVQLIHDVVKPIINRIEARQNTPQADAQAAWMNKFGDTETEWMFTRFHRDQLAGPYMYEEKGSLFPCFPDTPEINGMIAPEISMAEFQKLASEVDVRSDLLRPTTMLSKKDGNFQSKPLALDPRFKEDHLALAKALDQVAQLHLEGQTLDSKVQTQLSAWAQYCRTGDPLDEAQAAQATIDAGESPGMLRVHLGPSESYWPDNTKFPYLVQAGVSDKALKSEMEDWKSTHARLEASLSDIPHYTPRPVKTRGGFADPVFMAVTGGYAESFYAREFKGLNYPNYPYAGVEGSNRFQLQESMAQVPGQARKMAAQLLDKVPNQLDSFLNMSTIFHESGHLLGPQRSHITPSGTPMGVVFGSHWGWAEEPKADLTVAEMISQRAQEGKISQADRRDFMECVATEILSYYSGKQGYKDGEATDHYYGFLLQIGYYLQTGAVTKVETPDGPRLHLDPDKIETASSELWRKLITFESLGQKEEFLAFGNGVIEAIPEEVDGMIMASHGDTRPYFIERTLV